MAHCSDGGGIARSIFCASRLPLQLVLTSFQILPWDSDVDVQVSEPTMHFLASYYNMTIHHYKLPHIPKGRDYMLEINPYYVNRTQADRFNVIDARWIDTDTGLFIDITTVRKNEAGISNGTDGALMVKDRHHYLVYTLTVRRDRKGETDWHVLAGERPFPITREHFRGHASQGTICICAGTAGGIWETCPDANDI